MGEHCGVDICLFLVGGGATFAATVHMFFGARTHAPRRAPPPPRNAGARRALSMSRKSCVTALAGAAELAAALSGGGERGGGAHHAAPPPQLIVVDVHGWGGPTTVVEPLLHKLEQCTELWSRRVAVYTIDGALLSAEQRKGLPVPGSKPLFLVFKVRRRAVRERWCARADGTRAVTPPRIRRPAAACSCSRRRAQQQHVVAKILGANAPELEAAIVEHMPAVSEV